VKLWVERVYPWAGAGAVLVAVAVFNVGLPGKEQAQNLFSATVDVAAISAGFLGAALSILLGMESTAIVTRLRTGRAFDRLIGYMLWACHASLLLAVGSGAWLFFDVSAPAPWMPVAFRCWLACVVLAGLLAYRVIRIFALILKGTTLPASPSSAT